MAPRIVITEEKIKNAAFQLVREKGLKGLSARKLAARLQCSTQPLYRAFPSMENLKSIVLKDIESYIDEFIYSKDTSSVSLTNILLRFYYLALKERELFQLKVQQYEFETDIVNNKYPFKINNILELLENDTSLTHLNREQKINIILNSWIYMIGLFNITKTNIEPTQKSEEFIIERLKTAIHSYTQAEAII